MAAAGLGIYDIVKETGHVYSTVKGYLRDGTKAERTEYGVSQPSILDPYADIIDQMLTNRKTFCEIEIELRSNGYAGSASTIRMYTTRKRKRIKMAQEEIVKNTEIIERKWLYKLLYKPIENVKSITPEQLVKVMKEYPALSTIYKIVRIFKKILSSKYVNELERWIKFARTLDSAEINSFINGILRNIDAVKNAIRYDYNNGSLKAVFVKLNLCMDAVGLTC